MTVNVYVTIEKSFKAACSQKKAFDLLVDVADTVTLFPKLEKMVDLGENSWRWEMSNVSAGGISHQVKYSVKYSNDGIKLIEWKPVEGDSNNAIVSGSWTIKQESGEACTLTFSSNGQFIIPLPSLMKNIAEGMIKSEFEGQVSTYLERIKSKLES